MRASSSLGVLVLLVLLARTSSRQQAGGQASCDQACSVQRIHRMLAANCNSLNCKRFPRHLQSSVEVIDAEFNRIREISAADLRPYARLKILYLGENMITRIHPDAFAEASGLLTLDLSYNAFASPAAVPDAVFHLPSLRNLYLSQNQNINIVEVIERAAPLRAPLEHLDISHNNHETEQWQRLPLMGDVPTLLKYNVSGMDLRLNATQFAGVCNLEYWVNANVSVDFDEPCECWTLYEWLHLRRVHFADFRTQCTIGREACDATLRAEDAEVFDRCKAQHAQQVYQTKVNRTLLIGGSVAGVLLIATVLVVWRWRRMRTRQRRIANKHFLDACRRTNG